MDRGAAENRVQNMIDKVDVHLQVEMNILRKWKEKDHEYGKKYDTKNWPVVDGTQKAREIGKEQKVKEVVKPKGYVIKGAINNDIMAKESMRIFSN